MLGGLPEPELRRGDVSDHTDTDGARHCSREEVAEEDSGSLPAERYKEGWDCNSF